MAEREVRLLQAPRQLRLHRTQLHRVAARLEHRDDPLCADLAAQAVDGRADRRRVMGEVVVDRDAVHRAAHFHAALDVAKFAQCARRAFRRDADMVGRGDRRQRIELVVHAAQVPVDPRHGLPALEHVEGVGLALRRKIAHRRTERSDFAPASHVQDPRQAFLQPVHDHAAGGGHGAHQVVELALDRRQVIEDVGVVELQVVQDGRARAVVDELASLVEEGGVVFVGFDHEVTALPEPGRDPEVGRHPADQEPRLQARMLQHPGQHRGGGRLAMGAGDREDVAPLQHLLGQPLRPAGVAQPAVQDRLHQRVARRAVRLACARDHVADDPDVRRQRDLVGAEALDQVDAERAQLVAHGRIDARVAARDPVAGFARQRCDPSHERAADTENVDVHRPDYRGRSRSLREAFA